MDIQKFLNVLNSNVSNKSPRKSICKFAIPRENLNIELGIRFD